MVLTLICCKKRIAVTIPDVNDAGNWDIVDFGHAKVPEGIKVQKTVIGNGQQTI